LIATDLHSHILPGVDDGPDSIHGSLRLAGEYVSDGTGRVVTTPHINHRWGIRVEKIHESFAALQNALESNAIDLLLEFGGEVELTTAIDMTSEELDWFRLGGGEWLLIEPPPSGPGSSIHAMVFEIQSRGYRVLLAHPERCETFQNHIELLESLIAGGVRTQVTAEAITGGFGHSAQKASKKFFERELVHTVASDAHHADLRPPGLASHLNRAGYGYLYDWLCKEVPEAILSGGPPVRRPEAPSTGWKRLFSR